MTDVVLSQGNQLQCRWERVVDSVAMISRRYPNTLCVCDISMLNKEYFALCLGMGVLVSTDLLSSLSTASLSLDVPVEVSMKVIRTRKSLTLVSVSIPCIQNDLESPKFSRA